ncbi:MAG: hypothetical protein ACLRMN_16770 [Mediterraneibacter gnavus]
MPSFDADCNGFDRRKKAKTEIQRFLSLLVPSIKLSAVLYHPYGIGLTTLAVTALLAGITWKRKGERILAWGLIFILTIPLFSYLLNGGLYIRDKVLIPFLPLFCYLIAYYIQKTAKRIPTIPTWNSTVSSDGCSDTDRRYKFHAKIQSSSFIP